MSGALCDRTMSVDIKGKVYRAVVRPTLVYGTETWALEKPQEKMEVAEMRMLDGWMYGVTKLNKIRNERISGKRDNGSRGNRKERTGKEVGVVWACVEKRGAVRRKEGNGKLKQWRKKRRRPNRRWIDKVKDDIKEKGLSADEVYDRATWRRMPYDSYIDNILL